MSFDALAPHYRWMEFVLAGNKLQRCRTAHLNWVGDAQRVLVLGEGVGRFLVECHRTLPDAQITCLDASARMLDRARKRLEDQTGDLRRVEFIHANALNWEPTGSYDLIATHFFLDCFHAGQLSQLIAKLSDAAAPECQWLLSDFQLPASGLRRSRAGLILRMMYCFFGFTCELPARRLCPPDPFLEEHGFRLSKRHESEWGLLRSDCWRRSVAT
jgi:SAM-dependent methyltransferase